ncbi:MAG: DUF29 domain-containing protein [Hydrococcus sp. RM1_1_31]|nr:DUF29 domain-containing protein [Hydrococcus sp. RM1_1_31]
MSVQNLYETDFYAWTQAQVSLLRDRIEPLRANQRLCL